MWEGREPGRSTVVLGTEKICCDDDLRDLWAKYEIRRLVMYRGAKSLKTL